ncbi:cell surface A33 antigen [Ascaphus truei]|uniref:cell surface A33 antigen n=1 Tax=Ascaphus truei TaxID=8439 RepID=UPI003F5A1223
MRTQRRGCVTFILCAVLTAASAITVETPKKVVEAARGKSAALPCTYRTNANDRLGGNAMWRRLPSQDEVASYFYGQTNTTGASYEGRVEFTGKVDTDDASIIINRLTMEDNGTYQCEATIPKDRTGTPSARMDLLILVAPSKPECGIVGTAEFGQVIKLTCSSKEGSPIPQYTWKSYSLQDIPRQLPLTSVTEGGELTLKNVSADTTGFFLCTSTNKIGEDFCNITVGVTPPSMNIAFYAGIIGGIVAGIIVLGIIVYCCCCRNKEDKEDYEMADREEEEEEDEPPPKKPHQLQQKQPKPQSPDDDEADDDYQERNPRRVGPPMLPTNKPRLVINEVDA